MMPVLPGFLEANPDIQLEMIVDDRLIDIVAERIDAGIRFGDIVEKDMIAVRIGPDIRMAVVGCPFILREQSGARHAAPIVGPSLHQLSAHPVGRPLRLGV